MYVKMVWNHIDGAVSHWAGPALNALRSLDQHLSEYVEYRMNAEIDRIFSNERPMRIWT